MYRIVTLVFLLLAFTVFSQPVKLKLADALKNASLYNAALKTDALQLPISETEVQKSKLYQNPIFNLQYLQLFPSSMYFAQNKSWLNTNNSQDWFQLTKKFQVFGQRQHKISLAKLDHEMTEAEVLENRRQVLYQVSIKWVESWKALAYKQLATQAADYLDDYLKSHDSTKTKPFSADERLRVDILDDQYDLQEGQAEQEYVTHLEELKLLTGVVADSFEIDLNDTLEVISIEQNLDTLLQIAYDNRKDIKGLLAYTQVTATNIQYQKSLKIPQPEAGFIWNPQNSIPYGGIYFTQTLPFFDRNQTEIQKAKLMSQSSQMELEASRKRLNSEIKVAFSNYTKKKDLVRKFRHNLEASEDLLKMVRKASLKGEDPIVDIWEAEETWFETYSKYYDAYAEYRKSYVTLLYQLNLLEEVR